MKTKKCRGSCGEAKPLDAFSKSNTCALGVEGTCKACKNKARASRPRFSSYNMLTQVMKDTIINLYDSGMDRQAIVANFNGRQTTVKISVVDEVIKRHGKKVVATVFPNWSGLSV